MEFRKGLKVWVREFLEGCMGKVSCDTSQISLYMHFQIHFIHAYNFEKIVLDAIINLPFHIIVSDSLIYIFKMAVGCSLMFAWDRV